MSLKQKIVGRLRAIAKVSLLFLRFATHPSDFLTLYNRESRVASSALDVGFATIEEELRASVASLQREIEELKKATRTPLQGPGE
jgi:hypothetical protein